MHDIKCVIFDLDSCICDSRAFRAFVIDAMKKAHGLEGEVGARLDKIIEAESNFALMHAFEVPSEIRDRIFKAYGLADISACELTTYGDEHHIHDITVEKILVTAGFERLQREKIARLDIAHLFSEIHIDVVQDNWTHPGKEPIFLKIMEQRGLLPRQIAVLGDNPKTELGAGKRLGMVTIQTLRPTVERWDEVDHHVETFAELKQLIPSAFAKK